MKLKKVLSDNVPVSVLVPAALQRILLEKARREDLSFSQIVRRAIRKEMERPVQLINKTEEVAA